MTNEHVLPLFPQPASLPPANFLPTYIQTEAPPKLKLFDQWFKQSVEIDTRFNARLSSLYEAYKDACQEAEPELELLSIRAFTKRFEALLEFQLKVFSLKARDKEGVYFRAIRLKDASPPVEASLSESEV